MTNTCPRCRHQFRTLEEEYGEHPCPRCGWEQEAEPPADYQFEIDPMEEEGLPL